MKKSYWNWWINNNKYKIVFIFALFVCGLILVFAAIVGDILRNYSINTLGAYPENLPVHIKIVIIAIPIIVIVVCWLILDYRYYTKYVMDGVKE